jgi:hypothetical protein
MARQEQKESSDDIAVKQKLANFSAGLKRCLKEDSAASAKSTDAIVGLDCDPFRRAQDFGEKYTVGMTLFKESKLRFIWLVDALNESITTGKSLCSLRPRLAV